MVPKVYSANDTAALLNISPQTLKGKRCRGKGPKYTKIEGKIYYREEDIVAYLEGKKDRE